MIDTCDATKIVHRQRSTANGKFLKLVALEDERCQNAAFYTSRPTRIASWRNRQRVLHHDILKFFDGTALTDLRVEIANDIAARVTAAEELATMVEEARRHRTERRTCKVNVHARVAWEVRRQAGSAGVSSARGTKQGDRLAVTLRIRTA